MQKYENLVGDKPEDREKEMDDVTSDGQPIWMAFLNDPESVNVSASEVQDAKNAVIEAQKTAPEVINNCRRMSINECVEEVHKIAA